MPSKTSVRAAKWGAIPVALIASSALVWQASYSAFTASTDSPASNWSAGSVAISDDDTGSAMFNLSGATAIKPLQSGTKCIAVTVPSGQLDSQVKLYGFSPSTTLSLSTYLDLKIEEGSGGGFSAGCGGFTATGTVFNGTLASFATSATGYGNGVGAWNVPYSATTSAVKVYKFTWTLLNTVPNTSQGGQAGIGFRWEVQNT